MNVEVQRQDGNLIALVGGSVDGNNAAAFQSSLQGAVQEGDKSMLLDLGALVYISSAGLAGPAARRQGHAEQVAQTLQSAPSRGRSGSFSRSAASIRSSRSATPRKTPSAHSASNPPRLPDLQAWKCIPSPLMGPRCCITAPSERSAEA